MSIKKKTCWNLPLLCWLHKGMWGVRAGSTKERGSSHFWKTKFDTKTDQFEKASRTFQRYYPENITSSSAVHLTATATSQAPAVEAEIAVKPLLPPIPVHQQLPKHLQDMADRAKILTAEQRKSLENVLRINHDVFAKDGTSFGTCPWIKFTINTGNHKPIKLPARPISLHNRQTVRDTIKKYL